MAGTAAQANLTSLALVAGTWLLLATVGLTDTNAVTEVTAQASLGPTTATLVGNYVGGQVGVGNIAGADEFAHISLIYSLVLASAGSVFLNWLGAVTTTALGNSSGPFAAVTGLTAVRTK